MRIQHNIASMNAYRNYNTNTSALSKNLEKLSSGYKINRAGDDAAGLAISEKMRAQITGLSAAQKNVKDGISLVKTAEGAMQEIHDMLNRMDYLATQSANGTYDNEVDRANLQKEVESLKSEINRIADSANFNGIKLLNGDRAAQSTSALGGANAAVLGTIDGTSPSKAGAAEITLKLANNAAANSTILEPKTQQDGTQPNKATAAKIEITVGASSTVSNSAITANGTANTAAGAIKIGTGSYTFTDGDAVTVTLANGTEKAYVFDSASANVGTAGGSTTFKTAVDLQTLMEADGLTLDTATGAITDKGRITLTAGDTANSSTVTITDGKDLTDLLAATVGGTGKTVADLFNVKVDGSDATAATTVGAGSKITLEAKVPGEMDASVKTFADSVKGTNGKKTSTYTPGVDEGDTASANNITKYDLEIKLDELRGGMKLSIGTSGTTATEILFKTDGTASAANTSNGLIVNLNGSAASVAADLKAALDAAFGSTNFNAAESNADEITGNDVASASADFTYKIEGKSNSVVDSSNMGEIRVFDNGGAQTTTAAVSSTYKPAAKDDPNASTSSAFAKVSYEIDTTAITVGSKITIGDKTIEIVDGTSTSANLAKGQITAASISTDLAKALEQMGYDSGKVSVTQTGSGTAAKTTINIEGITVGQKAAELAKGAGQVSFMDASKAVASKATAGTNVIEAGTTKISDIKGFGMPDGKKLSDIFNITVNGNAQDNDYVIKEGDEIKFTAKNNGQYTNDVMTKFDFTGDVDSLSKKNGWDEGSGATGDKTHYELAIDMSKVAGGNSFTFGNVNGKSFTFDLSFDAEGTKNDTIGDENNTDIANNGNRTVINLYGLSTADAQKAIFTQVQSVMQGAGFDVTRSISGSKMTLALDAQKEGAEYNLGNIRTSSASGALSNAVYNPAGGNAGGTPGTMAQVTYKFDPSQLQAGDSLTFGDTTIYIGDEAKKEVVDGKVKLTISAADAQTDPNKAIVEALESAGYRSGQVRFDTSDPNNSTVTITGIQTGQTADDLKANGGKISLNSSRALEKGGLTLQIGDTAESFNQMIVSIGSMKTNAMGTDDKKIDGINISTQEGAKEAIDVIKGAINYVSSVRGDLGAIQNRLEHTGNNLSVMAENIQDAESTIRDTDVAEEMMSYVKNNILVQSAQAMLAQANQLPQGVLQLLG